ncbi:hypothetical protein DOY81_001447, partial [Sarcophaga bullata]
VIKLKDKKKIYYNHYQSSHLSAEGFILLPTGQLKALAKSSLFETAPSTRYLSIACSFVNSSQ